MKYKVNVNKETCNIQMVDCGRYTTRRQKPTLASTEGQFGYCNFNGKTRKFLDKCSPESTTITRYFNFLKYFNINN